MVKAGRVLLAAVAAVAAVTAGCSLLVATDDLTSPNVSDGGSDAIDARSADASSPTDGGTIDAALDGPIEGGTDAAVGPYCASLAKVPKRCFDFDTGTLSDFGAAVGSPMLDTAQAKSPPRSLLVKVDGNAPGARTNEVEHQFADTPTAYDGSFEVFVDSYDATHAVELVTVILAADANHSCQTDVSIRGGVWTFDESCTANGGPSMGAGHQSMVAAAVGRWVHVDYAVSFAPTRTFSFSVDGAPLFSATPLIPQLTSGVAILLVGIAYLEVGATSPATVHIDNVRFDYQ